jgi:hypothetical protein
LYYLSFFYFRLLITALVSSSFWPLYYLSFDLHLLITALVWFQAFDHCIICPSLIYGFWLPLWYLQAFDHCIICPSLIYSFWLPLWYDFKLLTIVLSVLLWFTASDYRFGIFSLVLFQILVHTVLTNLDIYGFLYVYFRLLIWGHARLLSARNTMRRLRQWLNNI